jgi:hypothetical protein
LLCIEIPAALRHFRVDILIQIRVERNERVIALDPDPREANAARSRRFPFSTLKGLS